MRRHRSVALSIVSESRFVRQLLNEPFFVGELIESLATDTDYLAVVPSQLGFVPTVRFDRLQISVNVLGHFGLPF